MERVKASRSSPGEVGTNGESSGPSSVRSSLKQIVVSNRDKQTDGYIEIKGKMDKKDNGGDGEGGNGLSSLRNTAVSE